MEKRHTAATVEKKKVKATVLLAFAKGQGALAEERSKVVDAERKKNAFSKQGVSGVWLTAVTIFKPSWFDSY